eukprot:COSAG01_NODE_8164_length_2894_cov_63.589624_2_plen_32_part_00
MIPAAESTFRPTFGTIRLTFFLVTTLSSVVS